jgi:hypothetical protein
MKQNQKVQVICSTSYKIKHYYWCTKNQMLLDKFIPFTFSNSTHVMQGLALQKENIELKKEVSIAHRHMMELQKKVRT